MRPFWHMLSVLAALGALLCSPGCATPGEAASCPGYAEMLDRDLSRLINWSREGATARVRFMLVRGHIDDVQVRSLSDTYRTQVARTVQNFKCSGGGANGATVEFKLALVPGRGPVPGAAKVGPLQATAGPQPPWPAERPAHCPGYKDVLTKELAGAYDRYRVSGTVKFMLRVKGSRVLGVSPRSGPEIYYFLVERAGLKITCEYDTDEETLVEYEFKIAPGVPA